MRSQFLVVGCSILAVSVSGGELKPSEPKTREWIESGGPGVSITNSDKNIDYYRDGKLVFRVTERSYVLKMGSHESPSKEPLHQMEFVGPDGRVFALLKLSSTGVIQAQTMISSAPVHFASGPISLEPNGHFIYMCVPKLDYFEYIELTGTEVKMKPELEASYAKMKEGVFKMTEKGFIHPLEQEQMLERATK